MSRHTFFVKDDDSPYAAVAGWDTGLDTYFFQFGDLSSDLPLALSTGQNFAEHHDPDIVIALAHHLGDRIPDNLRALLEADRAAEGSRSDFPQPLQVIFSTQAYNGTQLSFSVHRALLNNDGRIHVIANHILDGSAEREMSPTPT